MLAVYCAVGIIIIMLFNSDEYYSMRNAIGSLGVFTLPCIVIGCFGYLFVESRAIDKIESSTQSKLFQLDVTYFPDEKKPYLRCKESHLDLQTLEPIDQANN